LRSCIPTTARTPLARPQFRPANLANLCFRPIASSRCYATEPEVKKEGDAAAEAKEGQGKEAEAVDPAKKELEAKDKEIIDLKVCATLVSLSTKF
jgi:molecular chaperone GrpE